MLELTSEFIKILKSIPPPIAAALIASFFASVGFYLQRKTSREKNSLDFESNYKYESTLIDAIDSIRPIRKLKPIDIKAYDDYEKNIDFVLNEWESVSNGVFNKIYDEEMLYRAYGSTVISIFRDLQFYISYWQKSNPKFFIAFTRLAAKWQIRRAKEIKNNSIPELHSSLHTLHIAVADLDRVMENSHKTKSKASKSTKYALKRSIGNTVHNKKLLKRKFKKFK